MSRGVIERLRKEFKLPIKVCSDCDGDGEYTVFSGHDVIETCHKCKGRGYKARIPKGRSLK